jgi:hypothetical protein
MKPGLTTALLHADREAGNEHYAVGQQVIGNPPGNQGTVTAGQPGSDTTTEDTGG